MSATLDDIHLFFKTYGWRFDFEELSRTWQTGFRGTSSNFSIFVHLTDDWLYFTICPFVNAAVEPACESKLHRYLLRLNHVINLAKFGLDDDGDVVLTVELPVESLDYSEFADGLNALSYYADNHFREVLNLAQDPSYEPTFFEELKAQGELDLGAPRPLKEPN